MIEDQCQAVLYKILNTPIRQYPFEHFYLENIFPDAYYRELIKYLPDNQYYKRIDEIGKVTAGSYKERSLFPLTAQLIEHLPVEHQIFWQTFLSKFSGEEFAKPLFQLFPRTLAPRFQTVNPAPRVVNTVELVRDHTNYTLGPHTDHPQKILSLLFYLSKDESQQEMGTSLFVPRDPHFHDPSGHHHSFDQFSLVATMPFKPNALFGFVRTNNSWHGVLPINQENIERNTLSFQYSFM
jgi:hypothetical protein